MKKILLLMFLALPFVFSCSDDDDDYIKNWDGMGYFPSSVCYTESKEVIEGYAVMADLYKEHISDKEDFDYLIPIKSAKDLNISNLRDIEIKFNTLSRDNYTFSRVSTDIFSNKDEKYVGIILRYKDKNIDLIGNMATILYCKQGD